MTSTGLSSSSRRHRCRPIGRGAKNRIGRSLSLRRSRPPICSSGVRRTGRSPSSQPSRVPPIVLAARSLPWRLQVLSSSRRLPIRPTSGRSRAASPSLPSPLSKTPSPERRTTTSRPVDSSPLSQQSPCPPTRLTTKTRRGRSPSSRRRLSPPSTGALSLCLFRSLRRLALVIDQAYLKDLVRSVPITSIVTLTEGAGVLNETGRQVSITSAVTLTDRATFRNALTVSADSTVSLTDQADYVQMLAVLIVSTVRSSDLQRYASGVVLNTALALYLGDTPVSRVYAGSVQVWP